MPNVTTYIRKDDMELWLACPNKSELIHNALNDKRNAELDAVSVKIVDLPSSELDPQYGKKTNGEVLKAKTNLCEHFQPKGQCLQKGCKFGRL